MLPSLLSWDSRGFPPPNITLHLSLLWRGWELNPGPQALSLEQPSPPPLLLFFCFQKLHGVSGTSVQAVFILMLSFIRDSGPGKGSGQDWGSTADPVCGDPARSMSTVLATVGSERGIQIGPCR